MRSKTHADSGGQGGVVFFPVIRRRVVTGPGKGQLPGEVFGHLGFKRSIRSEDVIGAVRWIDDRAQ